MIAEGLPTSKVGVIILNVPAARIIQDLQFSLAGLGNVGKVLLVGAVHLLGIGLALLVPQVVPVGSSQSDLQVLNLLRRDEASKVLELVDIGAANMLDLTGTDHALTGLVTLLDERSHIGGIKTEIVDVDVLDLFESFQTGEEGAPEH